MLTFPVSEVKRYICIRGDWPSGGVNMFALFTWKLVRHVHAEELAVDAGVGAVAGVGDHLVDALEVPGRPGDVGVVLQVVVEAC